MVRPENIDSRLALLRKFIKHVGRYRELPFEAILADEDKLAACERFVFLACQSAIDLAEALCKVRGLERPESMAEGFDKLRGAGIIEAELCKELMKMVGFRNALSHGYEKFNYDVLRQVLVNSFDTLQQFERIAQGVV